MLQTNPINTNKHKSVSLKHHTHMKSNIQACLHTSVTYHLRTWRYYDVQTITYICIHGCALTYTHAYTHKQLQSLTNTPIFFWICEFRSLFVRRCVQPSLLVCLFIFPFISNLTTRVLCLSNSSLSLFFSFFLSLSLSLFHIFNDNMQASYLLGWVIVSSSNISCNKLRIKRISMKTAFENNDVINVFSIYFWNLSNT